MSLSGILLVDKPAGFTSFDMVAKLRGMAGTRKVGHAGTLDPDATGVLPLFLGGATRFIDFLPDHTKSYHAALQLGVVTDTQDLSGRVLETHPVTVGTQQVEEALGSFLGEQQQIPPMYSAVRKDGVRLYQLARQGVEVERAPRSVTFHQIRLLSSQEEAGRYDIEVECSRGAYIRTLCHDLGQKLGCGGAMGGLRRTRACGFGLEECHTLPELQDRTSRGELGSAVLPLEQAFAHLPRLELTEKQARLFSNGVRLFLERLRLPAEAGSMTVFDPAGAFLGLAQPDDNGEELRHLRLYISSPAE